MGSDDDNLNIKFVPLGNVKLFMLKTLSLEAISFSFYTVPKSDVNTCPPSFLAELACQKILCPSTMSTPHRMCMLKTIIVIGHMLGFVAS